MRTGSGLRRGSRCGVRRSRSRGAVSLEAEMQKHWDPGALASATLAKAFLAYLGVTEPPPSGALNRLALPEDQLLAALRGNRLVGFAASLADAQPDFPLDDPIHQSLRTARNRIKMRQLIQTSAAVAARDALSEWSVPALFIKGAFQSELLYQDPAMRGLGDLDILVAEEDFASALEALEGIDAKAIDVPTDARIARKLARVHHAAALELRKTPIDLHRRVDPARRPMPLDVARIAMNADNRVTWNSNEFATLSQVDTAILIACHGCKDGWSEMRSAVDFASAALRPGSEFTIEELQDRALSLRVGGRVEVALAIAKWLVPEVPAPSRRAERMAHWAWYRHRRGRHPRYSPKPHEAATAFAYACLAEGDSASVGYGLMRLAWLPSALVDERLPTAIKLALPFAAPAVVGRRIWRRSRGEAHAATRTS